jgi:DNA-binding CsgD family transcriptional regulator
LGDRDGQPLLERDAELAAIDRLITTACAGDGVLAVIEGEAGIGKTALLAAARRRGERAGMTVLAAAGGELEHEFAYGIARQLFEPLLAEPVRASALFSGPAALATQVIGARDIAADRNPFGALHSLYWVAVNLAAERPLLLVIDDAHWADAASLRYLLHLAQRIEGLPLLVLVATRRGEPNADNVALEALAGAAGTAILRPSPLSERAVDDLICRRWPQAEEDGFSEAARAATGGVPFLVLELLAFVASEGLEPGAELSNRVADLASSGIARATLLRLERLGAGSADVARNVAALGRLASPRRIAKLAGSSTPKTLGTIDRLAAVGILIAGEPVRFTHPITRAAVYDSLSAGERSATHGRIAKLLADEGAAPEDIGGHLLLTEPDGNASVLAALREAAGAALHRASAESAVAFLRRAAVEAVEPQVRAAVLHDLGRAEMLIPEAAALEHLREALRLAGDPRRRAEIALDLAQVLTWAAQWDELRVLLAAALAELGDHELDLVAKLEALRAAALAYDATDAAEFETRRGSLRKLGEEVGGEAGDTLLVLLASLSASRGEALAESADFVERVLVAGDHLQRVGGEHWSIPQGFIALLADERLVAAARLAERLARYGSARGSVTAYLLGIGHRGWVEVRLGNLAAAEADLRAVVGLIEQEHVGFMLPTALWYYSDALIERDGLADVAALAATMEVPPQLVGTASEAFVLCARGRLELARGQYESAAANLGAAGKTFSAARMVNPAMVPWRSELALALRAVAPAQAESLVATEAAVARSAGTARGLGVALRAAGLLHSDAALLRESCELLEGSPARLELARSRLALGAALRRENQRLAARDVLRDGLDLALEVGAERLVILAEEELRATGARPRRRRRSGLDALTPSEARVARMARDGMSNREIAQALFVTPKTVENQLGSVYAKLRISGRDALPEQPTSP